MGFLNDDPCHPVVIGSVYSANHVPPYAIEAANDTKAIVTRARHVIAFDEKNKTVTITTPGQNKVVLDDTAQSILVQGPAQQQREAVGSRHRLRQPLRHHAHRPGQHPHERECVDRTDGTGRRQGRRAQCAVRSAGRLHGKGGATAELSAAGQTTVQGAMVMIN